MWAKIRYFQNMLQFTGDKYLEYYGHRLSQCALFGGAVAIVEYPLGLGDELSDKVIIPISPLESDMNGNITKARSFTTPFFAGLAQKSERDRRMFDQKIITKDGIKGSKAISKACFFK